MRDYLLDVVRDQLFAEDQPGRRDARLIVAEAMRRHNPSKRLVLFSGGNDSAATLHKMWTEGLADAAVHINTGIGVPQTRAFVRDFCAMYSIPLIVKFPPKETYRELVLKHGFPGPGAHSMMYRMLKERAIEELTREQKKHRRDRIMLITGVRSDESRRRMGNVIAIDSPERYPTQVWVAPLIDWTKDDLYAYRREHSVPESEVAALLHMSGECLCGAFAHPDEIKDLEAFYPEVAAMIHDLEAEVRAAGKHCVWGTRPPKQKKAKKEKPVLGLARPLCSGCEEDDAA